MRWFQPDLIANRLRPKDLSWGVTAALMTTAKTLTEPNQGVGIRRRGRLPENKPTFSSATGTGQDSLPALRKIELGRLLCHSVAYISKQRAGRSKEFRAMFQKQQRGIAKEAAIAIESNATQHFADSLIFDACVNAFA